MPPPIRPPPRAGDPVRPVEEVLVVSRSELAAAGILGQGFLRGGWERCLALVAERGSFIPRDQAEEDRSQKQIIPYAVVTFEDLVFLLRRTRRGGEARLHGKLSIGVGGHVNPERAARHRLVEAGLVRELEEELSFDLPYRYSAVGLINDDESPVGQVHLGVVYRVEAGGPGVRVREEELLEGSFRPTGELRPLLPEMETWSRLVAEGLLFEDPAGGGTRGIGPAGGPA
jgi:predicted NUDIX family phosphoesterase